MDSFYDGDLKDIWDSDLDPSDTLKISPEADMNDWFLERDMKDSAVILNDKLISDALLTGTLPIKSEHSYSLNSDGDSLPDSPHSLHNKIDDMDDECYPAISFKTANSNLRHMETTTIDPKCLMISPPTSVHCSPVVVSSFAASSSVRTASPLVSTANASAPQNVFSFSQNQSSIYASLNKIASSPMTFNLRSLESGAVGGSTALGGGGTTLTLTKHTSLQQASIQYLPQKLTIATNQGCHSPASTRDGTSSPDICSDIEIDEACIKDEPMSPDYSCPSSPNSHVSTHERGAATSSASLSLSMANMAARTNSDLVFEHKNGCLQLTPASQSILKSQQLILGTASGGQNIIIPKFNIKTETSATGTTFVTGATAKGGNYGLPLTPPSSLSSDDSEGNLTPEHLLSPLSPNKPSVSISVTTTAGAGLAGTARRSTSSSSSSSSSTSGNVNCLSAGRGTNGGGGATTATTTRQPIHTPLISTQPKGSTGNLILTEEEKRTLLAEGYPIPQKLPLTKAEEKSLKKIRRKIKNKISAQESRRKKKEYMDQLERRVEILVNENNEYRKRVETLEDAHASLLSQLHKLQTLVNKQNAKKSS